MQARENLPFSQGCGSGSGWIRIQFTCLDPDPDSRPDPDPDPAYSKKWLKWEYNHGCSQNEVDLVIFFSIFIVISS